MNDLARIAELTADRDNLAVKLETELDANLRERDAAAAHREDAKEQIANLEERERFHVREIRARDGRIDELKAQLANAKRMLQQRDERIAELELEDAGLPALG